MVTKTTITFNDEMTSPRIPQSLEEQKINLERIIEHNLHLHETERNDIQQKIYYNRVILFARQYHDLTGKYYRRRT